MFLSFCLAELRFRKGEKIGCGLQRLVIQQTITLDSKRLPIKITYLYKFYHPKMALTVCDYII